MIPQKNIKLKTVLMQKGITQRDLAKITDISETHISMFINGRLNLYQSQQARVAEALDLKVKDIFHD